MKLFYIFKDPMGASECKIGVTQKPKVRLGSYQNSYSKKSHIACFDRVYIGPARAIDLLERAVKQHYNWQIERDGRGFSEWVSVDYLEAEKQIDQIIDGYKFKIKKVPLKCMPVTADTVDDILAR
jgi:hypothetical protein